MTAESRDGRRRYDFSAAPPAASGCKFMKPVMAASRQKKNR